jgi:four helix bundle protein
MALGSASEARYLLSIANRLEFVTAEQFSAVDERFDKLIRSLQNLISSLQREKE